MSGAIGGAGSAGAGASAGGGGMGSPGMQAGGMIMKMMGSYSQTQAEQSSLTINARLANLQAEDAIREGNSQITSIQTKEAAIAGRQQVDYAAGNIDSKSGSAARVQASSQYEAAQDVRTAHINAVKKAWGFKMEAMDDLAQSRALSPGMSALTTALGTGGTVAESWYKMHPNTGSTTGTTSLSSSADTSMGYDDTHVMDNVG
jgi:hypothetical protein